MRDPEYDRFGPWILEISEADPLPPLFRPHLEGEPSPIYSIKVPRKIERREAHPGMNLYDFVVNLTEKELVVLERDGENVRKERFLFDEIESLRHSEDLLKGTLRIVTPVKAYNLPFNSVSGPIIEKLTAMVRTRYIGDALMQKMIPEKEGFGGDLSFFFDGLLRDERDREPDFKVWVYQKEVPLASMESRGFHKLFYGVIGKRLLESMHLSDGRELRIISRGRTYKYRGRVVYGSDFLCIPLAKIIGATWESDPNNPGFRSLILRTAGEEYRYTLIDENPSIPAYAEALAALV